ncbi:MAG: N-acetylneuraminate synthase family protein [Melioribacteraceae bacterium]|nr:N-acetylneuraminate synthase family protein [Melioribacteraceae bacterium]MCF8263291.1 N-acetylneuraminate synthase family protein [Melioribacteraceae bacterium]MCF8413982.1 N-acetylneuraminate synthase family protein [Melioribacteraceae bacterium]MCF8431990.1 N-acetylneuraminate synthase family protein [Melioribacteraceae bacterium]
MAVRKTGNKLIGDNQPVYVIAEIGINHNGSLENAKKMIDGAVFAGCDAVKFQKRTPEVCVPADQWNIERDTPWGRMKYIDYRHKVEFGFAEFDQIDHYCKEKNIDWFASPWDENAVTFLEEFDPIMYKVASASLTDFALLNKLIATGKPIMLSTGMSNTDQIEQSVKLVGEENLLLAQSTSNYPCLLEELNIRVVSTYKEKYPDIPIGYSGHEVGLAPTLAAVALGATFVERHITLDRAMWGSDQAASVEINGMYRLVKDIRDVEQSLGDGIKRVYESEMKSLKKLRLVK